MSSGSEILDFYLVHRGELIGYARKILGDESHAEDVVQEAYFRFAGAAKDTSLVEPLAYLYKIVRNLCVDQQRLLKRDRSGFFEELDKTLANLEEKMPSAEQGLIAKQDLQVIKQALDTLPKRTRMAFEMHRFGDYTYKEIAQKLDISIGTAHLLVAQAIELCSQKISID